MTLGQLINCMDIYGPVGFTRDAVFACGAAPEVYYEDYHANGDIEECSPELLGYEVCGVNAGECDSGEYLEIGLYGWNGEE